MAVSTQWLILLGATLAAVLGTILLPRIPQWESYHHFVGDKNLLEIPNFWNVVTNFPFFIAAIAGFAILGRHWSEGHFQDGRQVIPILSMIIGVFLTGLGSSYYHWAPDNRRLVWDRLPMTIIFMSLISVILTERTSVEIGFWTLGPLLAVGMGSVVYWSWTESLGRGDLRPYGFVQFYPVLFLALVLYLFPKPFPSSKDFGIVGGFYLLAKIFETFDGGIYRLTCFMSGHALKHLAAAASAFWLLKIIP